MHRFDPSALPPTNICLYGDPAAGKTRLAATTCQDDTLGDVLWANVEGGLATLRDMPLPHPPLIENIDDPQELEELYWALTKRADDSILKDVGVLVIDNATDLVPIDLEQVVVRKAKAEKARTRDHTTRRTGIDDVWLDDRGETTRRLARLFRWFRGLDVHVVLTAHPRHIIEGQGDHARVVDVRTEFPAALRRAVEGYQDHVWYLHRSKDGTHKMLTHRRGRIFAKTRGEKLGALLGGVLAVPMDRPMLPDLFRAISTYKLDPVYQAEPDEEETEEETEEASEAPAKEEGSEDAKEKEASRDRPVRRSGRGVRGSSGRNRRR